MKTLSAALQTHLDSGTTTLAWCWRLTRNDGQVFGFTDHDVSLSFDGTTFQPESGFAASEIRSGSDLAVDSQDTVGVLTAAAITETDILDGRWDNAAVEIWRVNWADTAQRVMMRRGAIGQGRCECGDSIVIRSQTAPARIVKAARRWIGTPYHDQASVREVGCDCLGLIRGVWRDVVGPEPIPVPPYSRDWGETGPVEVLAEAARAAMVELEVSEARTGDVILFRMCTAAIAKHCGILSGAARGARPHFIHAYERSGVIEEVLTPDWQRRIAYAFRFPIPTSNRKP